MSRIELNYILLYLRVITNVLVITIVGFVIIVLYHVSNKSGILPRGLKAKTRAGKLTAILFQTHTPNTENYSMLLPTKSLTLTTLLLLPTTPPTLTTTPLLLTIIPLTLMTNYSIATTNHTPNTNNHSIATTNHTPNSYSIATTNHTLTQ